MTQATAPRAELPPDLARLRTLGWWLSLAESKADTPEVRGAAAALRFYYAEQLELPPLAATELSMIGGRLVMSAQLKRALVERDGYRVVKLESTAETCTAALVRVATQEILGQATFTMEDAATAGPVRKGASYETHPARMLWARASSFVVNDYAPGVALGILTQEEAAEIPLEPEAKKNREFISPAGEAEPTNATETYEAEAEWR